MIRRHIIFTGWVQGVGFRYRARHAADLYGCTGWVRNEWEGSVTMEIQGEEEEPTGTDLSGWVSYDEENGINMTLAGAAAYRTSGASKATPGFDVMDYGQEDYVFGSADADARHWDQYVLKVLEENADTLSELFNAG